MPYAVKIWVVHIICTFVKKKGQTATRQVPKQQKFDVKKVMYRTMLVEVGIEGVQEERGQGEGLE